MTIYRYEYSFHLCFGLPHSDENRISISFDGSGFSSMPEHEFAMRLQEAIGTVHEAFPDVDISTEGMRYRSRPSEIGEPAEIPTEDAGDNIFFPDLKSMPPGTYKAAIQDIAANPDGSVSVKFAIDDNDTQGDEATIIHRMPAFKIGEEERKPFSMVRPESALGDVLQDIAAMECPLIGFTASWSADRSATIELRLADVPEIYVTTLQNAGISFYQSRDRDEAYAALQAEHRPEWVGADNPFEDIARTIDRAWRDKKGLNCTEVCAIIRDMGRKMTK